MKPNICFFFRILTCFIALLCGAVESKAETDANALVREQTERLNKLEISLLTCQPHDEVYSLYGHTAIRVKDTMGGEDYVINYGVFDTRKSLFVLRFIFGLTDYTMEIFPYEDFIQEYKHYGCGVYEQHINMDVFHKAAFIKALSENIRPENAVYRYNFFYNNCTTKARDIIINSIENEENFQFIASTHGKVVAGNLPPIQRGERSFRDLVHMKTADYPWARFGNDLLLGVAADANTTYSEREFLPEVFASDLDSAIIYSVAPHLSTKLVDKAVWVLKPGTKWQNPDMPHFPLTPFQCAMLIFILAVLYSLFECFYLRRPLLWVHYVYTCLYAFVGIILFLMLFSQHPTVRVNFQILIFNPLFYIFALPKYITRWGKYAMLTSLALFFVGNFLQCYAEGVNIMAAAMLVTFLPILFCRVKKM